MSGGDRRCIGLRKTGSIWRVIKRRDGVSWRIVRRNIRIIPGRKLPDGRWGIDLTSLTSGRISWIDSRKWSDDVAFLIQYHGEQKAGDSRGQLLTEPIKTIDTSNRYGFVTAFVTKFYKTGIVHGCDEPLDTITTSPGHFGLISAFLIKYYGIGVGQVLSAPLGTITTKDRFGQVNAVTEIDGEKYVLKDIFLRMLKPEELKLMQGFPKDYIIDRDYEWKKYPIAEQVKRIGNSVVPIMAEKLVLSNCPYLKVGDRIPNMRIDDRRQQL